jgi:hypothetical protein
MDGMMCGIRSLVPGSGRCLSAFIGFSFEVNDFSEPDRGYVQITVVSL